MVLSEAERGIREARVGDQGPERKVKLMPAVERAEVKARSTSGVISKSPVGFVDGSMRGTGAFRAHIRRRFGRVTRWRTEAL